MEGGVAVRNGREYAASRFHLVLSKSGDSLSLSLSSSAALAAPFFYFLLPLAISLLLSFFLFPSLSRLLWQFGFNVRELRINFNGQNAR